MQPQQFARLGQTRSVFKREYALIAPDSHVPAPLVSWRVDGVLALGVVLIAPVMGARFSQTLVTLVPGQATLQSAPEIERFIYVMGGAMQWQAQKLESGSYLYLPPGVGAEFGVGEPGQLLVFEKRFVARAGEPLPEIVCGREAEIEDAPFLGDPDARLKLLLPDVPAFDMAVNIFTYQPGATLPFVETHVMEHGLWMLEGEGIYRLSEDWHSVAQHDTIWMASFCPQWFAATGKVPSRYLYYKDVNRAVLS